MTFPTMSSSEVRRPMVLIVDDLHMNRKIYSCMMTKLGFSVVEAHNGLEACDIYNKEKGIVAVLLDLNMPLLDGWQTAERLRQMEGASSFLKSASPRLPVIVCTANDLQMRVGDDEATVQSSALSAGADEVLRKPVSMTTIVVALDRHLPLWRDIIASSATDAPAA